MSQNESDQVDIRGRVKIRTTTPFPLPPITSWPEIHTSRLLIRVPRESDAAAFFSMRVQPEVMTYSTEGRVDEAPEQALTKLKTFLPPNDSSAYSMFVFDKETGEFIGNCGIRQTSYWFGWPEVGYSMKRESWGRGYATEFLTAIIENWWKLPRREVEIEVDDMSVESLVVSEHGKELMAVPERLTAMVERSNGPSRRLLDRAGFHTFRVWNELDNRAGYDNRHVVLYGFAILPPAVN